VYDKSKKAKGSIITLKYFFSFLHKYTNPTMEMTEIKNRLMIEREQLKI
tara:strand:+ start:436 stop:582 length:147 start_codon:yes stop_codon:yes gene_type:complete